MWITVNYWNKWKSLWTTTATTARKISFRGINFYYVVKSLDDKGRAKVWWFMYDTPGPGFPNTFQTKFSKKYGTREFIAAGIRNAHRRPEIFRSNQTEHRLSGIEENRISNAVTTSEKMEVIRTLIVIHSRKLSILFSILYRDNISLAHFFWKLPSSSSFFID